MAKVIVRKHYYFSGRVQGVGFRYKAMYLARGLGLTGKVRNLYDGRVEMEVQGETGLISLLLSRLQEDRFISVSEIEETDMEVISETSFQVTGY